MPNIGERELFVRDCEKSTAKELLDDLSDAHISFRQQYLLLMSSEGSDESDYELLLETIRFQKS